MAFGLNFSTMAPAARQQLPDRITQAIQASPASDRDTIQLMGQVLFYYLKALPDTAMVDVNVNGNQDPNTMDKSLVLSVRARDTAMADQLKASAWTPDQGPMSFKTDDSAPAAPAAAAARPTT